MNEFKKFRNFLPAMASAIIMLTACSQEETVTVTPDEPTASTTTSFHKVSVDQAKQRLSKFFSDGPMTRSGESMPEIESVYTLTIGGASDTAITIDPTPDPNAPNIPPDLEGLEYAYIFNFSNNGGFAITAAVEELPQVMAFSDAGYLEDPEPPAETSNKNPGLELFYTCVTQFATIVLRHTADDGTPFDYYKAYEGDDYTLEYPIGDGLCPVQWHQEQWYYYYCPKIPGYGEWGTLHYPVGCGAVAVGQLMACHQYPSSYYSKENNRYYNLDWPTLINTKSTNPNSNEFPTFEPIPRLLKELGEKNNLEMTYGPKSECYFNYAPRTLQNFGYSCGKFEAFSKDKAKKEILAGYPFLMSGDDSEGNGHAWLVEGIVEKTTPLYSDKDHKIPHPSKFRIDSYIKINWGWENATGNGYFLMDAFQPFDPTIVPKSYYIYNNYMIINIRKGQ